MSFDPRYPHDRLYMEEGLGYNYPAGTPGPRSTPVTATCSKCGWTGEGVLIRDLGTADLIVDGKDTNTECPHCGQEAPPLKTDYRSEG